MSKWQNHLLLKTDGIILEADIPCHTQAVERHTKLVTALVVVAQLFFSHANKSQIWHKVTI